MKLPCKVCKGNDPYGMHRDQEIIEYYIKQSIDSYRQGHMDKFFQAKQIYSSLRNDFERKFNMVGIDKHHFKPMNNLEYLEMKYEEKTANR